MKAVNYYFTCKCLFRTDTEGTHCTLSTVSALITSLYYCQCVSMASQVVTAACVRTYDLFLTESTLLCQLTVHNRYLHLLHIKFNIMCNKDRKWTKRKIYSSNVRNCILQIKNSSYVFSRNSTYSVLSVISHVTWKHDEFFISKI